MLRTATNKTYLFGLLKVKEMCIWIRLVLVAPCLPNAFVWHLHSPGWGCPTGDVTNFKPAKGREVPPCSAGRVLWWLIENGVLFEQHSHVQTPLTNQLSKGFYVSESQKLLPLTAQDEGKRAVSADKFTLNWKILNVPSGLTICPSTWLLFNPLPSNMVRGRKDALLLINEWSYLLFII